jgi:hypothetical protein
MTTPPSLPPRAFRSGAAAASSGLDGTKPELAARRTGEEMKGKGEKAKDKDARERKPDRDDDQERW